MKKNLFLAALAFVALASCTSDEFVGDNTPPTTSNTAGAIQFGSNASKITRATSNTGSVAEMLDGQFKVYGTKNVKENNADVYSIVFPGYVAWSNNTVTTSNPDGTSSDPTKGWEYVGSSGQTYGTTTTAGTLSSEQTIKYWDYAADNYHFVAGSPVSSFSISLTGDISTATVSGLAGHINANSTGTGITTNPVYIAEPVNVIPDNYAKPVTFNFVRQQAKVRVGVFETIPGYKITNIKFYPYSETSDAWETAPVNNIVLASTTSNYFQGGTNDVVEGTITYDWSTTPASYSFTYNAATGKTLTQQKNWYGGEYNYAASDPDGAWGPMAITSTDPTIKKLYGKDADMDVATGYFTVLPTSTSTAASALLIKCDYTLEPSSNDGSNEKIYVKGATAAIPAAFCKWAPNTSYTYLFKISDNTNGYTGATTKPAGLFPITFDAVVVTEATGNEQGTITTVSTPSITTYQAGSVVDVVDAQTPTNSKHGIEYKTGTNIYLTVQDNTTGVLNTLGDGGTAVGAVQVYKLSAAIDASPAPTEADLQLTAPTGTDLFTLGGSNATVDNISFTANQYGYFNPSDAGYYAIQYLTAYDNGTVLASGTALTGYYERSGTSPNFTYTAASGTADGSKIYYKAAYTYKVVKVVAASSSSR